MQTSSTYRAQARESLQGRWSNAVTATFIYFVAAIVCYTPSIPSNIQSSFSSLYGTMTATSWWTESLNGLCVVLSVLIVTPLSYALLNACLQMVRGSEQSMTSNMWGNLKGNYVSYLTAGVLVAVLVSLLGLVTFGIGAAILSYAYRMVPLLLNDYPEMSIKDALKTSRQMMKGQKWNLFVLDLSFIGWYLLGIITLCIGYLWLTPYQSTAVAHFYEDLKAEKIVDDDAEQVVEEVNVEEA